MPRKGQYSPAAKATARHERVRKIRGNADRYDCVGNCGKAAQEHSISDYLPSCCSCHQKYDDHWNAETRRKVSQRMKEVWAETPERQKGNTFASGKRTPEQCENIGKSKVGNTFASGKRTPEQCERIRIARWGR